MGTEPHDERLPDMAAITTPRQPADRWRRRSSVTRWATTLAAMTCLVWPSWQCTPTSASHDPAAGHPTQPASAGAAPSLTVDPASFRCQSARDCVVAPWHYPDEPCCNAPEPFVQVQAKAFVTFRDQWQRQSCARVDCARVVEAHAPQGAPAPPAPCYFEPRCVDGRCTDACASP